jgi:hypothetical protein
MVHQLLNALGAVLVGTAIGMLLRDNLGFHRPARGRRLRANLVDLTIGVIGAVIVTLTLIVFP